MGEYRIFKKALCEEIGDNWQETSFVGDKKTIERIVSTLAKSKYHIYEMRLENN